MSLTKLHSGKIRDIYDAGNDRLLMVASDRISAFDVVMTEPIRDKGRVLTGITAFWLKGVADLAPSHLLSIDPADFPPESATLPGYTSRGGHSDLDGRTMLVRRADMLPIECIVRGFLAGSAWKEYTESGTVHGVKIDPGLQQSSRLPEPIFTPSTKATDGHDENITVEAAAELVGAAVLDRARELCLAVYGRAAEEAATGGIILADTKFELGFIDGELAICDEVLTPDSSRFWDVDSYQPGTTPPSFDKQPLRDWLEESGWDKTPPPPFLPYDVVRETSERYVAAYQRLTGMPFGEWRGVGS